MCLQSGAGANAKAGTMSISSGNSCSPVGATVCLTGGHAMESGGSIQVSAGEYWPGRTGRKSLIGLPNISCAGDRPSPRMGVFLCWSMA